MSKIVVKYGGSSLDSIEKMQRIAKQIKSYRERYDQIYVVTSAMGKTTNELIKLASSLAESPNLSELDRLVSTGEIVSSTLLALILNGIGCPAKSFSGAEAGIITNDNFTNAYIMEFNPRAVIKCAKTGKVCVLAGFQGVTRAGQITTLGRGGSDTTAVMLAGKLKCECIINTDVNGVMAFSPLDSAPRRLLTSINYDDMISLANAGARVMDSRATELGKKYDVDITVKSSFGRTDGTNISSFGMERMGMYAMTYQPEMILVKSRAPLDRLFRLCTEYKIKIQPFNVGESCTFLTKQANLSLLKSLDLVTSRKLGLATITIVGGGLFNHIMELGTIIEKLKGKNIKLIDCYTSANTITLIVHNSQLNEAYKYLTRIIKWNK